MEKWNAQRAQAVAHALLKVLYPLMEKEMRNKLLLEAKEHVLQVYSYYVHRKKRELGRERERDWEGEGHLENSLSHVCVMRISDALISSVASASNG